MNGNIVLGEDVAILLIGSDPVACLRSYSFVTTTSFIETTTAGSGNGATYKPKKNNTTMSLEGVVSLGETGKFTLPEIRAGQLAHTLYEDATIVRTNKDGTATYTDTFDFYIVSVSDTGAIGDFNTFSVEIQVNGDPVLS